MRDISGFGIRVRLVASSTFPAGISLTQFADDADPLDFPDLVVGETAMGVNGDMVNWSKANVVPVTLNVIPGTEDDQNLAILLEANRVGRGKSSARDRITLTALYPDGTHKTVNSGVIVSGKPGKSVGSSGRLKSQPYTFNFEGLSGR